MNLASGQVCINVAEGDVIVPEHLPAPSPMNSTGPCARYSEKLSGSMISGLVGETCVPSALNIAVYTSIRLASIMGTIYRHPSGSSSCSIACHTSVSKDPTAIRGMPLPKHKPFAVETPTRSPVYEPGPMLTHTAEQSLTLRSWQSSISLMNGAVREACFLPLDCRDSMILPSSDKAVEHSSVDVSMKMILSIFIWPIILSNKGI